MIHWLVKSIPELNLLLVLWWLAVDGGATRLIIHNSQPSVPWGNNSKFNEFQNQQQRFFVEWNWKWWQHVQRYDIILLWRSLLSIMKRVDFSCVELKRHSRAICLPRDLGIDAARIGSSGILRKSQFCGCMIAVRCFGDRWFLVTETK